MPTPHDKKNSECTCHVQGCCCSCEYLPYWRISSQLKLFWGVVQLRCGVALLVQPINWCVVSNQAPSQGILSRATRLERQMIQLCKFSGQEGAPTRAMAIHQSRAKCYRHLTREGRCPCHIGTKVVLCVYFFSRDSRSVAGAAIIEPHSEHKITCEYCFIYRDSA